MGFIEELRRQKEAERLIAERTAEQTRVIAQARAEDQAHIQREETRFLKESRFSGLVLQLSGAIGGEAIEVYGSISLFWERYRDSQKMIEVQARSNGIIEVRGGFLGTSILFPNQWIDLKTRESALEKAFRHPRKVRCSPHKYAGGTGDMGL